MHLAALLARVAPPRRPTFQEDGRLFEPPFTEAQVAVLKAGGVPEGIL